MGIPLFVVCPLRILTSSKCVEIGIAGRHPADTMYVCVQILECSQLRKKKGMCMVPSALVFG